MAVRSQTSPTAGGPSAPGFRYSYGPAHDRSVHPARSARRGAAAAPHGRAHASRRAGGELLVPPAPRRLRVDRRAGARAQGRRPRVRRGLRRGRALPHRRERRRRRRQPRGLRPRQGQVPAGDLRAQHDRVLGGRRRLRRVSADDRAHPGPGRDARPRARADRARRRGLRVDPQRAHACPQGRGALRQSLARARVPARGVPRAVRAPLRAGRPARPVPRAQAAGARARAEGRVGPRARRPAHHAPVLRALHPRDLRARLHPAPRRPRALAGPARRAAAVKLVLHTHMPYVEGFGTWPFGEEWLWEAIATSYLPLLDVLDAHPGKVTLSITPVLADQLEAPGALERCLEFLRTVRPASHKLDADDGFDVAYSAGRYAHAADALERRGDLIAAFAPHVRWTSSATHAILPLLATDAGVRLQLETGIAAHRARFGAWDGGFWLPECAHAPWLDALLEEAGVHVTCVDWSALGLTEPVRSDAGVVLVPLDRPGIDRVWARD